MSRSPAATERGSTGGEDSDPAGVCRVLRWGAAQEHRIDHSFPLNSRESVLLACVEVLHQLNPLLSPELRTEGITLQDVEAYAQEKFYKGKGHYRGALLQPMQFGYGERTYELHLAPSGDDCHLIVANHYLEEDSFGVLRLKNDGRQDFVSTLESTQSLVDNDHYCVMSLDELEVLLQGHYNKRPEEFSPKKYVRSPGLAPGGGVILAALQVRATLPVPWGVFAQNEPRGGSLQRLHPALRGEVQELLLPGHPPHECGQLSGLRIFAIKNQDGHLRFDSRPKKAEVFHYGWP